MELAIHKIDGKKSSKKVKLDDAIFAIEPNDHAIYLDVKQHMANKRQGTAKSKERSEITGSRRKIKRQKGTGTARAGDIKSPLFRGGGRAFGPRVREYNSKLNKKVKKLARRSALSHLVKDDKVTVLEDFNLDAPKTKKYMDILSSFDLNGKKNLLVVAENNKNVYLSSRNIPKANVMCASDLNTYAIMNAGSLLLTEGSIKIIEETLNK